MDIRQVTGEEQVAEEQAQVEILRGENGQFLPGKSPNPGGRPKKTQEEAEALEMIRHATPEAVEILLKLLRAEKGVSSLTKVKIIEMMLDRTYGKPDTAVKVTTEQLTVEEAQAELEVIIYRYNCSLPYVNRTLTMQKKRAVKNRIENPILHSSGSFVYFSFRPSGRFFRFSF